MKNNQIRLAISGINGRMGQSILKVLNNEEQNNILLSCLLEKKTKLNLLNKILYKSNFIKIDYNIMNIINKFDVLIDFTNPYSTIKNINICKKYNKKIVIGTTGFNNEQKIIIKEISKKIAVVLSSNFSQGINILFKIIENITEIFCKNKQKDLDIDIIEKHHKNKVDLPSGTALSIKDIILHVLKKNNVIKKINFHSIRAADLYGEHNILFSFIGEQIELTHKASNRISFAKGAIQAAIWISNKQKGIYNMQDILEI
ncbi:4-hydroxy-tetrahydrodipicolinate reductase [Enterobacteriaceae endosymbiont of Donacia versicolorea]|uniref:4-hydroxy-tetrahydrodipicolinate reductase n=1 Tax=Enterobacteriaceae endosymbiont of Donacia versicolorea TaxID=2675788 RepID=UPI0014493BFB|nr:4-hydroxy-tetrahydrodipicolinate reductase [Enterobacteriaceae endosymbiont of Donacia versicolorea]QJC31939.1 4-hydroxy-tetrahydrodipicolinate reductase [Enterobacteriaceae endosymbiont of Donacia versicolorea]